VAEINPTVTAKQLATAYTQQAQGLLDSQNKSSQASGAALTKLQSALQEFDGALKTLSGKKSMAQYGATLSDATLGTATVGAGAQPGSYPLFVEQVATRHQVVFADLPAVPTMTGGTMAVRLGNGSSFTVDLRGADTDGNGTLSQAEIARAINAAADNKGAVTAMVMTVDGQVQLMLSAGAGGAEGAISVDPSTLPPGPLKDRLSEKPRQLVAPQDAVVWLGPQGTGMRLQQGNNTLTAIDGVSLNLTKAMKRGDPPAILSVSKDEAATGANIKAFVDGYNALQKTLGELTANGNRETGKAGGAFAQDSGVRALHARLSGLLRQPFNGYSLLDLGVSADRSGNVSFDPGRLAKTLAVDPAALDMVFGSAALGASTGVLGAYATANDQWLNGGTGQIKQRQNSAQTIQKSLTDRQTRLDDQYAQSYDRYLRQYSTLQALQSRLGDTTSMLKNLGKTDESS
jgi:flagellar hook-associated protein 2